MAAGQEVRDVSFRITPLGAIFGRVFDEDGDPVPGVGIQVLRVSYNTGRRQLIPVAGASSNDRGEYRCYDLPAGRYFIMASPRSSPLSHPLEQGALVPEVQDAFVPVYYPGVVNPEAASAVALPDGGEVGDVNVALQKMHAATLRGRLLGPVKSNQGQLEVFLAHNEHGFASFIDRASGVVDPASGRFEFRGVAPGGYLLIGLQNVGRQVFASRLPVEIAAETAPQDINLSLVPGNEVQGSIRMEDGSAPPAKTVVRLVSKEGLLPIPPSAGTVSPDGSFRLQGILPGEWELALDSLPEGVWVKSVSFADSRVAGEEINIPPGGRGPLQIVMGAGGAQLSGSVTKDGQPQRASVVLVPAEPELQRFAQAYRTMFTNENGIYVIKNVPPGQYRLFAFESIEPFAWMDPAVMSSADSVAQSITVGAGDRVSRDLTAVSYEATVPSR